MSSARTLRRDEGAWGGRVFAPGAREELEEEKMEQERAGGDGEGVGQMRKRRITLEDGRYLIFYTFGEEAPHEPDEKSGAMSHPEPQARPVAEEERRV